MLQTEVYLYDRKLQSQTFIVQATGVERPMEYRQAEVMPALYVSFLTLIEQWNLRRNKMQNILFWTLRRNTYLYRMFTS
jgi:hypothetical protein